MARVKNKSIILCCSLAFLSGCVNTSPTSELLSNNSLSLTAEEIAGNRALLTGGWIRSQPTPQGGKSEELAILKKDGTFEFRFRETDKNGAVKKHTDVGVWGLVGNVHFTIVTAWYDNGKKTLANMSNSDNYRVYEVIELNQNIFEYKSIITGKTYRLRKAQKGYLL